MRRSQNRKKVGVPRMLAGMMNPLTRKKMATPVSPKFSHVVATAPGSSPSRPLASRPCCSITLSAATARVTSRKAKRLAWFGAWMGCTAAILQLGNGSGRRRLRHVRTCDKNMLLNA